jgi:hypothetical protein
MAQVDLIGDLFQFADLGEALQEVAKSCRHEVSLYLAHRVDRLNFRHAPDF